MDTMNNRTAKRTAKRRVRKLKRGRPAKLGLFEIILCRLAGTKDAKAGIPAPLWEDARRWRSPRMNRYADSFREFCSRSWGLLQIENEPLFEKLENLMSMIQLRVKLIGGAEEKLKEAEKNISEDISRREGEENLSEKQVKARRKRERERNLRPSKARVNSLRKEIEELAEELLATRNRIREADNVTRFTCEKVRNRTCQRIDVYWNAVIRNSRNKEKMPVDPCMEISSDAEDIYMSLHGTLLVEADELLNDFDKRSRHMHMNRPEKDSNDEEVA